MQMLTSIEYLKVDIANNIAGANDKMNWNDRIAVFDQMVSEHSDEAIVKLSEEPALVYAGLKAYRSALVGEPSGYPISLDACSSGLQLLSILIGCEQSAQLCGVVSTGHRADAYTIIYQAMLKAINDTAKISRADCKQAIMTALYASTAVPKQIFGEGALLQTFYDTMETMAPGAWELNKALKDLWQPMALSHDWVMPDNFHVHVKVISTEENYVQFFNAPVVVRHKVNVGTKEGLSLPANVTHSVDGMVVREMARRCMFSKQRIYEVINALNSASQDTTSKDSKMVMVLWSHYQETGFLSTRILDHLNQTNMGHVDAMVIAKMIQTFPNEPFQILTIHDCFRCLPNYGNDLRKQYNQILSEIAASSMLQSIASQISGRQVKVNKLGDLSAKVLVADYALS